MEVPLSLYNNKTQSEWRRIISLNLPKGFAFEAVDKLGTNMYYIANAYALVLANFDQWMSETIESLRIYEDSDWLDYYWDKYNIGKYMTKPSEKQVQVDMILAFAYARRGLFTFAQFTQFFESVFGSDVEVRIGNASEFKFEYDFPITFYGDADIDWVVVVGIKPSETLDSGFEYLFDFQFYPRDTKKQAIQALMEELVDINFRIVFEDIEA